MTYEINNTFTLNDINEQMFTLLRRLDSSILSDTSNDGRISFSMSPNIYTIYNTRNSDTKFLQYSITIDSTLSDTQLIMLIA